MLKNKKLLWFILPVLIFAFSINIFATPYTYTQESGTGFFVASPDKSDALEDTNEVRQIVNDLGTLLGHTKLDGTYPKDLTTGGTLSKFDLYYLITETNTLDKWEAIWSKDVTDSDELAAALTDYYLKIAIDTQAKMEAIWGVALVNDGDLATYQPLDTALTNISALAYVSPSFIELTADDTYAVRTFAEMKTDLAYQLSDLSDVNTSTPTDKYVLVADGTDFESRALVEADISDLGTYLTDITGESILSLSDVAADPNADKYLMWDDSASTCTWQDAGLVVDIPTLLLL